MAKDDKKIQCDTHCKRVLSHKRILAWILSETVKEFVGFSLEEIESCIEGEICVGSIPIAPGRTNAGLISGSSNEDAVEGEGEIRFDIIFHVMIPDSQNIMKIIINVEAQKNFHPGYSIVTRGVYYAAREISAQAGREFEHSHYDDIKKVYSIWICMNAPNYIGNAISEYSLEKKDIIPGIPDKRLEYDKMTVVMITLNRNSNTKSKMVKMLNALFALGTSAEARKTVLENEYGIQMDAGFRKEYDDMCNLSEYFEEAGLERGMERGHEQGSNEMIIKMIQSGELSDDAIIRIAGITKERFEQIKESEMTTV